MLSPASKSSGAYQVSLNLINTSCSLHFFLLADQREKAMFKKTSPGLSDVTAALGGVGVQGARHRVVC